MLTINENQSPSIVDTLFDLLRPFDRYFKSHYTSPTWYVEASNITIFSKSLTYYPPCIKSVYFLFVFDPSGVSTKTDYRLTKFFIQINITKPGADEIAELDDLSAVINGYTKLLGSGHPFSYNEAKMYTINKDTQKAKATIALVKAVLSWFEYHKRRGKTMKAKPIKPKTFKLAR